jgi:3-oxoacyl-[acyl-carrier-protein] synthase II
MLSGFGMGKEPFWNGLIQGSSAVLPVDEPSIVASGSCLAAMVPQFSAKEFLPVLRPPYPSRFSQMALVAAKLAIEDAGLDLSAQDRRRTGVLLSADFGPIESVDRYLTALLSEGPEAVSPMLFARTVTNVAVGDVARHFGLKGPSSMLTADESICYAFDLLRDGRADLIVCGGLDELSHAVFWSYKGLGLLAESSAASQVSYQPYAGGSNTFPLGEGAAFLVLERLQHVVDRRAPIYAEVLGYSTVCGQNSNYLPCDRTAEDLCSSMCSAINSSGTSFSEIAVVVGCASSHAELGRAELTAVSSIFGKNGVQLTSIKGAVGETFGSSGALAVSAGALALKNGLVPPCGTMPMVEQPIEVVTQASRLTGMGYCLCNSVHTGGSTTAVLLAPYREGV